MQFWCKEIFVLHFRKLKWTIVAVIRLFLSHKAAFQKGELREAVKAMQSGLRRVEPISLNLSSTKSPQDRYVVKVDYDEDENQIPFHKK